MKNHSKYLHKLGVLVGVTLLALAVEGGSVLPANADSLYVGDNSDNTVKRFDAKTGKYQGKFVTDSSGGLTGVNGIIFVRGKLLASNQNVGLPVNGNVLQYSEDFGNFIGALFPDTDPNAPFAPLGIVDGLGHTLYVADYGDFTQSPPIQGKVKRFDDRTGKFLGNLDITGFTAPFYPRGVVFGPDGLLYVSATGNLFTGDATTGYILRFTPYNGKFLDVFTSNQANGCAANLHRPEGLVFGPDGNLYVTSFRNDASDTDKILVFDGKSGKCIDSSTILLDQVGQARTYAQALLFGPNGQLFVPITNTGEVRSYNVKSKSFNSFVPVGGPLSFPWFLTFGNTDPATLDYETENEQ